jgi:predicted DNA-binding transcriptional regulator AlpA
MRPQKLPPPCSNEPARNQPRRASLVATERQYLTRRELLALVPLSMSSIDSLEKAGSFPSRFVLAPTVKVCWKRAEIERWLAERARTRVHHANAPPSRLPLKTLSARPPPIR